MKRTVFIALFFVLVCLLFGACKQEPEYDVKVPRLMGGSGSAKSIVATEELIADKTAVNKFFSYRIAPPITGFSNQTITEGARITAGFLESNVTLSMSRDSGGNFIFEGSDSDGGDYYRVKINSSNTAFEYVHVIKIDGEGMGSGDELDIVIGKGTINSDNSFEGCGTLFFLKGMSDNSRMKFVFRSNGQSMGCYYYSGNESGTFTPVIDNCTSSEYSSYIQQASFEAEEPKYYVAAFNGSLLNVGSLSTFSILEEVPEGEARNIVQSLYPDDVPFGTVFITNGFGLPRASAEACQGAVSSWEGFIDWNLSSSVAAWNGQNNY